MLIWFSRLKHKIPNIYIFQNVKIILLVIFQIAIFLNVDSQPLSTKLTNSQLIQAWKWPKSNSQIFPKFPTSVETLIIINF